jgi:hypothetical protein
MVAPGTLIRWARTNLFTASHRARIPRSPFLVPVHVAARRGVEKASNRRGGARGQQPGEHSGDELVPGLSLAAAGGCRGFHQPAPHQPLAELAIDEKLLQPNPVTLFCRERWGL